MPRPSRIGFYLRLPRAVRRLTDPLAERIRVPIMGGVNRGRWWSLASAGSGYATGRRAAPQMRVIQALVQPGDVVWDVGAHHGYMSLCAAARAGMEGEVHAFEPSGRNRRILERHIRWNSGLRMVAHPYALSSFEGEARFGGGATSKSSALDGGLERVNVRTGASLIDSGECPSPSFLKLDVEDAEGDVVEGLGEALPSDARLLIAVHSAEADRKCCELLERRGFELMPSPALLECRQNPWTADPDLLCIGPDYIGRERMRDVAQRMGFSR